MATVGQHIRQSAQSKYSDMDFDFGRYDPNSKPATEIEHMGFKITQDAYHPQFWVVRTLDGKAIAGLGGSYTPLQRAKVAIEQYHINQRELEERKELERQEHERQQYGQTENT